MTPGRTTGRRFRLALAAATVLALAAPAVALAAYGAVAVNKRTGIHGIAAGPTRGAAESSARQACGAHCVVVGWVQNQCVAVVRFGHRFWAGLGATKAAAVQAGRLRAGHARARLNGWICPGPGLGLIDYGAIAVNRQTGGHGLGFASDRTSAEQTAEQACAGRCVVLAWVFDECAAVVHVGRRYSRGLGATKPAAIASARRRAGNPGARLTAWVCA